ncbi:cytochrome P450 [Apodospora peruviana]|uniref:Cytochrome P450 n=1 Tax=Apodospora peruviana TaxID=516989 RepID=A0AAE0MAI1_9PEZI|nr:cytochrome P450 [Apodospora peruviana]
MTLLAKLSECLDRPAVVAPVVLVIGYIIYQLFLKPSVLPKQLDIIGAKKGDWFPTLQAKWRNTKDFKAALRIADAEFRDRPGILPLLGVPNLVLLPRGDIQFVQEQPENVLNMHVQTMESLQTDYTSPDPELIHNPVHNKLITTTLTNQTGNLVPDMVEETAYGFEKLWGTDTEYKDVCVYDTLRRVIGLVTNRVFVGNPLCRNEEMLELSMQYAQAVPAAGFFLVSLPKPIHWLVARATSIPLRRLAKRYEKYIRPEIEARLSAYDASRREDLEKKPAGERNDFLQWSIAQAKESGDPYHWKVESLAGRILLLNFASIHTSSFSITHVVLDLAASKQEYVDELRAEIKSVLAEHGGQWNKRALAKMEKLDSLMRESSRMNSFVTVGLMRRVVAKGGITTPSGVTIPCGASVCVPAWQVLHDETVYPDAETFKPFRFAEQRKDDSVEYVKRANKAWATASNEFLAFGHGRNACPGRFFATNELKLMLGYLVMNYDIEIKEGTRPRNNWYSLNRVPSFDATVRIKRRVAKA